MTVKLIPSGKENFIEAMTEAYIHDRAIFVNTMAKHQQMGTDQAADIFGTFSEYLIALKAQQDNIVSHTRYKTHITSDDTESKDL